MMPRGMYGLGGFGTLGASATSLTDLYETDALLDRLGSRSALAGSADGWESWDTSWDDEAAEILLLRALVMNVDSSIAVDLDGDVDPVAVAALAAGFELAGAAADGTDDEVAVGRRSRLARVVSAPRLHLVGGTTGRRLPRARPARWVAALVGVALALGGGSLAAAATTDPAHAWGPLRPLVDVFHPGWQDNLFAAKRSAILQTLQRASEQSKAGQHVAAAVTYGAAQQEARDLPKPPDAALQAKFDSVAREIGLTGGPSGAPAVGPPSGGVGTDAGSPPDAGAAQPPAGTVTTPGLPPTTDPSSGTPSTGTATDGTATGTTGSTTGPDGGAATGSGDTAGSASGTDGSTTGTDGTTTGATPTGGSTAGSTPDPATAPTNAQPAPSPQPSDPGQGSAASGLGGSAPSSSTSADDGSTKTGGAAGSATDPSSNPDPAPTTQSGSAPASGSTQSDVGDSGGTSGSGAASDPAPAPTGDGSSASSGAASASASAPAESADPSTPAA